MERKKEMDVIFDNEGARLLMQAIVRTDNLDDCKKLLEDLMSYKEIIDMSQRMEVVKLLRQNMPYTEICEKTGASTATISRVNKCYVYGNGGYKKVFDKIENNK